MAEARVWGGEEEPELAKRNAETYVAKRWKSTTKECRLSISGRELEEGTGFEISAYTDNRRGVGRLAERLLEVVTKGDTKVYFLKVDLYDQLASVKEQYRGSMQEANDAYRRREQILIERFRNAPEVRSLSQGNKPIEISPATSLLCELESDHATKLILEVIDDYYERILKFMQVLVDEAVGQGLAKRIVGYRLWEETEGLEIESAEETNGVVYVSLSYPANRHEKS